MQLSDGAPEYALAKCPMPECGQTLMLMVAGHQDIYLSFTPEDFELEALGLDLSSWQVCCLSGHVLLLPPDDGAEDHEFGKCTTHDIGAGDEHGPDCGAGDFARLQRVLGMAS